MFSLLVGVLSVHSVLTAEPCSTRSNTACCTSGVPFTTEKGEQVSCARGTQISCPTDYSCFVNEVDKWAVCCPAEKVKPEPCSTNSNTACCTHGVPHTESGVNVFCGRGSPQNPCPQDYSCFVHAADRWAVCCPPEEVKPVNVKPPGYSGLRLSTVCLHVPPDCVQMSYRMFDGEWYRVCDIHRPGCRTE